MFENTFDLIKTRDQIFSDTCSLMNGGFAKFYEQNRRFLLSKGKRIIVPHSVIAELERLGKENSERGNKAKAALQFIRDNPDQLFEIYQSELRPDDFLLSYAAANRSNERILVITQDYMLCRSIVRLNEERTGFYDKTIFVKRVSFDGSLQNFDMSKIPAVFTKTSNKTNASVLLATLMK